MVGNSSKQNTSPKWFVFVMLVAIWDFLPGGSRQSGRLGVGCIMLSPALWRLGAWAQARWDGGRARLFRLGWVRRRTAVGLVSLASARPQIIDFGSPNVAIFCAKVARINQPIEGSPSQKAPLTKCDRCDEPITIFTKCCKQCLKPLSKNCVQAVINSLLICLFLPFARSAEEICVCTKLSRKFC